MAERHATQLRQAIADSLQILEGTDSWLEAMGDEPEGLASLIQQAEQLLDAVPAPQPVRSIHHLACTGGTLISKAIAGLPGTVLLSEIDPLSEMPIRRTGKAPFAPTDLILSLRHSVRPVSPEMLVEVFLASVDVTAKELARRGQQLVIRDHAHSQFSYQKVDAFARPTLREMLARRFPMRSVVTVRHPLDAYLAVSQHGWIKYENDTLEEYCRRTDEFLRRHHGVPVLLYEDFTAEPKAVLRQICGHLDLPYSDIALDAIKSIRLTGDSGRSEAVIAPRSRRPIPDKIETQRADSTCYQALCAKFGYDP